MSGRLWLRSPFESLRVSGKRRVAGGEGLLDGDGALEGARGGREGGHDAVAGVLDLGAAVGLEGVADDGVVAAEELLRAVVAEALGEGGGALHVGEQDRHEAGRGGGGGGGAGR